jgi:hypothetical protein
MMILSADVIQTLKAKSQDRSFDDYVDMADRFSKKMIKWVGLFGMAYFVGHIIASAI